MKKFAYKGTNADMKSKNVQFELGQTYYLSPENKVEILPENAVILQLKPITDNGALQYEENLESVFLNYSPLAGENRFFKVEIVEYPAYPGNPELPVSIKFVEEVAKEEVDKTYKEITDRKLDDKMNLPLVQKLMTLHPSLIIGGSVSLYLQGARLRRFGQTAVDLDFTTPYFILLTSNSEAGISIELSDDERTSEADFGDVMTINEIKTDIRIDPKQKYEVVRYRDFDYKVIPMITIIKAKVEYAGTKNGGKHLDDLKEFILKK